MTSNEPAPCWEQWAMLASIYLVTCWEQWILLACKYLAPCWEQWPIPASVYLDPCWEKLIIFELITSSKFREQAFDELMELS